MQNDKFNKKKVMKKSRKNNSSQPGLTRLTRHMRHEIKKKNLTSKRRA